MSAEIIKVLDYFAEKFGIVIDWSSENVLPYIEALCGKIVTYELYTSVYWLVIGIFSLLMVLVLVKLSLYCAERHQTWDDVWEGLMFICVLGAICCVIVGVPMVLSQIHDIVTCIAIPEKIVIEQVSAMLPK